MTEKVSVRVTEADGTVIPLGDVIASTPDQVELAVRQRIENRKQDLPPSGEVVCEGSLTPGGGSTVEQLLQPSLDIGL